MKKSFKTLGLCIAVCFAINANSQLVNCNPDDYPKQKSSHEFPAQYWVEVVSSQPESYAVDANGDVHIYSAEGLAWLVSTVNGLNGQDPDDFNGKK